MSAFGIAGQNVFGGAFGFGEAARRLEVWKKGRPIPEWNPAVWRHDDYGYVIRFSDYGNNLSEYGWEIDHIVPVAVGGSDDVSNLRPLSCRKNASLGGILGNLLESVSKVMRLSRGAERGA